MYIYNLTQHKATPDQERDGVVNLSDHRIGDLKTLLDFDAMPSHSDIVRRAKLIARLVIAEAIDDEQYGYYPIGVMIGGAPWLMPALTNVLKEEDISVFFAYPPRVSKDIVKEDGSVEKVSIFEYQGLFEV